MSTEENKAIIRRLTEEMINRGNFAVVEDLVAEDWQSVDPRPGQENGRKGLIASLAKMRAAFPDLERTYEVLVAEGDTVAGCYVMHGTHQGEFMGIPPTGKRVTVRGMFVDTFAAGQCKISRNLIDTLSLMQQLGVVPVPGE